MDRQARMRSTKLNLENLETKDLNTIILFLKKWVQKMSAN